MVIAGALFIKFSSDSVRLFFRDSIILQNPFFLLLLVTAPYEYPYCAVFLFQGFRGTVSEKMALPSSANLWITACSATKT